MPNVVSLLDRHTCMSIHVHVRTACMDKIADLKIGVLGGITQVPYTYLDRLDLDLDLDLVSRQ